MQPFHRVVPGILEKIPVLIYAGDADFICNWLGNQAWTEALQWPGQKGFKSAKVEDIKLDNGDKYGKIKSSGNFAFLQVFKAGHSKSPSIPHSFTHKLIPRSGAYGSTRGIFGFPQQMARWRVVLNRSC